MYYNWYDEATGEPLTTWPTDGNTVYPFLSSVDNGWLAAGSDGGPEADRATSKLAQQVVERMNFNAFYNPTARTANIPVGLLRGGFWDGDKPPNQPTPVVGNYLGSRAGRLVHRISTTTPRCPRPASRPTSPSPAARCRPSTTSAPGARSPTRLRLVVAGAATGREDQELPRRRRLRRRVHLPRHADRARLGWLDVRGDDAGDVRPRGEVGAAVLGDQPPTDRARPSGARPRRGRSTGTGDSPRPANPAAATASTASTPSG